MRPAAPLLRATPDHPGAPALRVAAADAAAPAGVLRRVGRQVAAGIGTSVIAMLAAALTTPIYLRGLGAEAYGVLAFVMSMQAVLLALDAGIGLSITRLVARGQHDP